MPPNIATTEPKPNAQVRIDGKTRDQALEEWKETAAEHAEAVERWRSARATRDVRLSDLVKAHDHDISDTQRAQVSRDVAKAVAKEASLLEVKQEAKAAVDVSWKLVQSFNEHKEPTPLIPDPDDEDDDEEDAAIARIQAANEKAKVRGDAAKKGK